MPRTTHKKKVGLRLTADDRALLLEIKSLPPKFKKAIRAASADEPIGLTPDEAFRLAGYITVEANLAKDKQRRRIFDVMSGKIHQAICLYAEEIRANPIEATMVHPHE